MISKQSGFSAFSGQTDDHVVLLCKSTHLSDIHAGDHVALNTSILGDLQTLADDCSSAGWPLGIASGYRSFERQFTIWSEKALGRRPVLDRDEREVRPGSLSANELLRTILFWSAVPGASRHHWGTDFDIFPANLLGDRKLALTRDEAFGIFGEFYDWLGRYLSQADCPFYRPFFGIDRHKGLALSEEPWHLSHRAASRQFIASSSLAALRKLWGRYDLPLLQEIDADITNIETAYLKVY